MTIRLPRWLLFLALGAPLCGCRASGPAFVKAVDKSMAQIRCGTGLVGAPPPPANADVDHIPVPFPIMTDPRTLQVPNAGTWELDLNQALAVAIGNGEVVRVLPGATSTTAGSTLGGSSGGPSLTLPGTNGSAISSPGQNNGSGGFGPTNGSGGFGPGGQANSVNSGAGGGVGGQPIPTGRFATIYDPAIAAAQVQSALGAFDASLAASMFWERIENPPDQTFGGFLNTRPRLDTAYWNSSLTKLLTTGATAGMSFYNNYYFIPPPNTPPTLNPQYQTHLEFSLQQPLLRNAGTQVNRVNILVAGARANQTAWEFKRRMMAMVRSVETAYWNVYSAQISLQAVEEALPLYAEVVRIEEARLKADAAVPADVAQAQNDYLQLRTSRLQSLSNLATNQALLRNLLGMPPTDGRRIVITEKPLRAPLVIDWNETISIALDRRPDIIRQRLAVHVRELQLLVSRNGLLPQLNGQGLYRINGVGSDLPTSLDLLTNNQYQSWQLGASFQYPLGNNVARGQMRAAQMQLLREQALLKQNAHIATHQLGDIVRELYWVQQQYDVAVNRQMANLEWRRGSRARFLTPAGYVSMLQALQVYLASIRSNVSNTQEVAGLLAQYNIALAKLEESKGTLLSDHNIVIFNDPCTAVQRTTFRPMAPRLIEEVTGASLVDPTESNLAEPVPPPATEPATLPVPPAEPAVPPVPPMELKPLPPAGTYEQPNGLTPQQGVQQLQQAPAVEPARPEITGPQWPTARKAESELPQIALPVRPEIPKSPASPATLSAAPAAPAPQLRITGPATVGNAAAQSPQLGSPAPLSLPARDMIGSNEETPVQPPAGSHVQKSPAGPPLAGRSAVDDALAPIRVRGERPAAAPLKPAPLAGATQPAPSQSGGQRVPRSQTLRIRESAPPATAADSAFRIRATTSNDSSATRVRDSIQIREPLRLGEPIETGKADVGGRVRLTIPTQAPLTATKPATTDSAAMRWEDDGR